MPDGEGDEAPGSDREWWTASDVADALGVHRGSVHRIPRDQLSYTEHGGRKVRHYDPEAVRTYLALRLAAPDESLAGLLAEHTRRLDDHDRQLRELRERQARDDEP